MNAALGPHQRDILRIFRGLGAAPGQMVEVATLWLNWHLPGAAFADAVEALAAAGLLTGNQHGTRYALTDSGHAASGPRPPLRL